MCACYIGLYAPPKKQNILYNICRPTMLHKCQSCTKNVIQMFCVHWAVIKHLFYTYFLKARFISNLTRRVAYLQYCGLSCYSIHEKVTLRPCCCDTDVGLRNIYWYRITCISYMKLGFPTFYGAK